MNTDKGMRRIGVGGFGLGSCHGHVGSQVPRAGGRGAGPGSGGVPALLGGRAGGHHGRREVAAQRDCEDEADLRDEIATTVIHEIAHHFGIGEERLEELGWG